VKRWAALVVFSTGRTTRRGKMKTALVVAAAVLVIAPTGYAVGVAHDPRVPALQRQVRALQTEYAALKQSADTFASDYVGQNVAARVTRLCLAVKQIEARNPGTNGERALQSFLDWFVITGPGTPAVC
jgi:hypothetical protein